MKPAILSLFLAAFASAATLTLSPSQSSISAGNSVVVDVLVNSATPVYGWELTLAYTVGLASGLTVTEGSFLSTGGGTTFFDALPDDLTGTFGPVTAALNGAVSGVAGSGTLVRFTLQGLAPGTVNLAIVGESLLDETLFNIATTTTRASFLVTGAEVPEPSTSLIAMAGLVALLCARGIQAQKASSARQ